MTLINLKGNTMYNTKESIHEQVLPNGDLLIITDKVLIKHKNGNTTGSCLDLRCWYDRKGGFIERKTRTDKEVIILGKKWADNIKGEINV
jgi:hypothetical protein